MTHDEALAWWFARVNYETRPPGLADLKLERMRALLRALGDPQKRLRVLHVAGSKGKGSTSAMLAAILRNAGHRIGLFTSPHLVFLEERFQVDGLPITRPELTQLLIDCRAAEERHHLLPTFFEIATALGFLHFERRCVTAAILEVGLGGRLDSTNVCSPAVSVITSISLDHTNVLGDKLAMIAREKAGIIKPGRPVISGVAGSESRIVIERAAREIGSPLRQIETDFRFLHEPGRVSVEGICRPRVRVETGERAWPWHELNLLGEHQAANAAVAIATIEELCRQGWTIPDDAVATGLATVEWPARMEVVRRRPFVILDCAHNVASVAALVRTLDESFPPGPRTLLFAASNDKDVAGMCAVLRPAFGQVILTRYTNNPRAMPCAEMAALWGPGAVVADDPVHGLQLALASEPTLVCITGSVFLAGQLRPLLVTTV